MPDWRPNDWRQNRRRHRCFYLFWGLGSLLLTGCSSGLLLLSNWVTPMDISALPPCVDDDCNCGDFISQPLAQQVLDGLVGDPYNLDSDGNGRACETLPAEAPALDAVGAGTQNPHLVLGNPSRAGTTNPNNYLIERSQYALSYSRDRNLINWASWEVDAGWLGSVQRQDNFRPDGALPQGFYQVTPNDYRGSNYDRGHVVPSGDRTRTTKDNSATFLMTNIWPQAPQNNRGLWRELEEYTRDLVYQYDRSLHVFAGAYGQQGTLGNRAVTIPTRLWKIVVVYDRLDDGRLGVGGETKIIAVDMPNTDRVGEDWRQYQTSIDRIELATGYDFLADLPEALQAVLESRPSDEHN